MLSREDVAGKFDSRWAGRNLFLFTRLPASSLIPLSSCFMMSDPTGILATDQLKEVKCVRSLID